MLTDRHFKDLSGNLVFSLLAGLLLFAPLARGGAPGWAMVVIGLVVLTGAMLYLVEVAWRWQPPLLRTVLDMPILVLSGLVVLAAVFSVDRPASLVALAKFAAWLGVYCLVATTLRVSQRIGRLANIVIGVTVFLALFALVKGAGLNPCPWWDYPDLPYPKEFLAATFGNHNHLAGWLEMAIPLLLGGVLHSKGQKWLVIKLPLLALLVTVLILTQSRGGWLGFLAGLFFMGGVLTVQGGRTKRRWVLALVGGIGLLVVAVMLLSPATTERALTAEGGVEEGSLAERIEVWRGVAVMIKAHPLLGSGPGTFKLAFPGYQPPGFSHRWDKAHNDYLEFAAELGVGFWAVMGWLLFLLYRQGLRKYRSADGYAAFLTLGALTGITSLLVHSLVDFNLQLPANALLFTVLAALVAGKGEKRRQLKVKSYKLRTFLRSEKRRPKKPNFKQ